MKEPIWLDRSLVEILHQDQIRQHGGLFGLRDEALLESALARPRQRLHYEPGADLFELAASLGHGLASNHPFVDGNKRVAFLALYVFLGLNGHTIEAEEAEVVAVMKDLAAGRLPEADLALWLGMVSRHRHCAG